MSVFNMIVGYNPLAAVHLTILKLNVKDIPRFRNTYRKDDTIIVMTRTGGANRELFEAENKTLQAHPMYASDFDDTFDPSFAHFVFNIPTELLPLLVSMPQDENPMVTFQRLVKEIK